MAAHHAQQNSRERGRAQQLGNENREIRTQYESVIVASLNNTERALFNFLNDVNQRTYQNTQYQSTTGIYPSFAAYLYDLYQSYQKGFN